ARFANLLAGSGMTPAQASWKAGADILSLGATKNGALAAEAVILFPSVMNRYGELQARQKRAGHMVAKMRYVAAQFDAWLADNLWLDLAEHANEMAKRLSEGLSAIDGVRLAHPVDGNEIFVTLPEPVAERMRA
ncbi:MAG TPA: threonine aldolase, partial [Alphaproteobacteria bacterium]|nr:threonine aldolase [Alphaproteobacteria bacterium]